MPAATAGLGVPPDLFLATSAGGVAASRTSGGGLGRRLAAVGRGGPTPPREPYPAARRMAMRVRL